MIRFNLGEMHYSLDSCVIVSQAYHCTAIKKCIISLRLKLDTEKPKAYTKTQSFTYTQISISAGKEGFQQKANI